MAKVLTGCSCECQPDPSLQMPPLKKSDASSQRQLVKARYDSVNGVTHGCRVYMTYDNEKAYPAYLIKYSETV